MSGWLDLTQLGLSPNQKHQALLVAPKRLTQLIRAWSDGDQAVLENLIALVEHEMRRLAHALLRPNVPD